MAIAGRVAIVPKGDWSADATYKRLDAVTYNNTLYFAKKDVPAGTATSNTEYWSKSVVGGASAIATTEDAGVVKPDGKSMSVDESGTLSINLDGTTITLDEAKNVIKLADALKDKIGSALQPESIVNNQVTTETGFALDARQANPNIDGSLAKQISDLNGSLNNVATKNDISALNPSADSKLFTEFSIGRLGAGWYRIAEIIFSEETSAKGATSGFVEILINQEWNSQVGCFHKVKIALVYSDKAKISSSGIGTLNLTKVRVVRKSNILYFDIFSRGYDNGTRTLLNIPLPSHITSAKAYNDVKIVPETADGEVIVCSVDLANNI
jgi:hypothetical protein